MIQVVDISIHELLLKFLFTETSPNPQPKFITDPISIPFLTKLVLGGTTISPMVGITTLNS
jgi:hypothetical protein